MRIPSKRHHEHYLFILLLLLPLTYGGCALKDPLVLKQEAAERQRIAKSPDASCWERAQGFKTTRTGYYKMAPPPEAVAWAGPLNFIFLPALGITSLVMGIFTVPYDLVALPFRCSHESVEKEHLSEESK